MQQQWTAHDLARELRRFEAELRAAELKETSVQTYVSRAGTFVLTEPCLSAPHSGLGYRTPLEVRQTWEDPFRLRKEAA